MAPLAPHLKQEMDLIPSDEDDEDFTLDNRDSDSSSDDSEDDEPSAKRAKVEDKVEPAMTKEAIDDLWASFNAPEPTKAAPSAPATSATTATAQPAASTSTASATPAAPPALASTSRSKAESVKIKVTYEFVGEKIEEDKMVPADSAEAIAYFALHPEQKPSNITSLFGDDPTSSTSSAAPSASTSAPPPSDPTTAPPKPALSGAPKRKKAGGLAAMAASLGGKPAKLSTLEKSKLDWNKHVAKEGLEDDLTKARKDGYLDKKDFLDRAAIAKEDEYDKMRRGGRR